MLITGALSIIAIAVWGGQWSKVNPFSATYDVMAGVLAVSGSVFGALDFFASKS